MRYAGFNPEDIADCLNGFCCSFWTQGCPFHCKGCHNPESWDFNGGEELNEDDYNKMLSSFKSGIHKDFSILGGEPLANKETIRFLDRMVKDIKSIDSTIKVYIWTGYTLDNITKMCKKELLDESSEKSLSNLMSRISYIIDGQFEEDKFIKNLPLRGSSNQRIRENVKVNNTIQDIKSQDISDFFQFVDISETVDKERHFLG